MGHFRLEIMTPEKRFFDGDCESLIIDTPEGKIGIMSNHRPMVAAVAKGTIAFKTKGEWKSCFCTEGFAEVRPDETIINTQIVEWPEEMEARLADEAQEKSEEHLRQEQSLREFNESRANIARTMAKLKVKHSINDD
jgi:F-type H+-transporting ATPase subunit epsilon